MEITFDETTGEYEIDGRPVARVTRVLADTGLTNFTGIAPEVLAVAAQRGTYVHDACRLLDDGDLDFDELDPVLKPYVSAYARFRDEAMWTPQTWETKVGDPVRGYAGRYDMIGLLGFVPTLIDLKSGQVYRSAGYQLAAYQACIEGGAKLKRAVCQLRNDGTYRIHKFESRDDIKIFYSALTVYQARQDNGAL